MVRFRFVVFSLALLVSACGQSNQNISDAQPQQSDASEQTPKLGLATPKVIPAGYKYEGVGFTMSSRRMGLAVHRLFNTSNGNHLYTINNVEVSEAVRSGYRYEGIAFFTAKPGTGAVPVYRLYHPSGYHFYTASDAERNVTVWFGGMKYEGVAFMAHCLGNCESPEAGRINVHRFHNGRNHFYSVTGQ